jgi:hypothetical protein
MSEDNFRVFCAAWMLCTCSVITNVVFIGHVALRLYGSAPGAPHNSRLHAATAARRCCSD